MMRITGIIAARAADPYANPPARIVCLGDSVTHGCFEVYINRNGNVDTIYDSARGYVRLLQDRLFRLFPAGAVTVVNSGISGDGSAGALKRFDRDVAAFSPDLVTVNLGLNDCMGKDPDAALAAYRENMAEIFHRIADIGAEAMLITPNMMCSYVSPELPEGVLRDIAREASARQTGGVLSAFVDAARELAREAGVPVADAYAEWQALDRAGVDTTALLSNHINHPAYDMHELFMRKIVEQLI